MSGELRLLLDHVSLRAPAGRLEGLGLTVTPTPESAGAHARVLLDGGYLEVRPGAELRPLAWFARPATPGVRRWHGAAARAGMPVTAPVPYRGADGVWLDVSFDGPGGHPLLPVVTERVEPAEPWPPAPTSHAAGAQRIARIELEADGHPALADLLGRAGLGDVVCVLPAAGAATGIRELVLEGTAGELRVLAADGPGRAIH